MTSKQQKLLDSILACVPACGWTDGAIIRGAKGAKMTAADARGIFPDVQAVADAFHDWIDAHMDDAIRANRKFPALRVRDKITFAVKARLLAIEEYEEAMRRLLVWSMMPRHLRYSTRRLWGAADHIWNAAGDISTDYNHYTKRLLLIGVMKATLSFWLNDTSKGHEETWAFLDRRINDVMVLGKGIGGVKAAGISDVASFARSVFARAAA